MKNYLTKTEAQKHYVLKTISKLIKNRSLGTLYYDMFEHTVNEITEKDGRHYYNDRPILNYNMLELQEQLEGVIEKETILHEIERT